MSVAGEYAHSSTLLTVRANVKPPVFEREQRVLWRRYPEPGLSKTAVGERPVTRQRTVYDRVDTGQFDRLAGFRIHLL